MGKVFLAERLDYGGVVAIKLLHDVLSPERRARFATEQKMLAQLNHPSIARLYDAGSLPDGTPFFAMEYVEGLSLIEYCAQQHIDIRQRLLLYRQVCGAVQFAHQHGIIHRDLKPSNIVVNNDGIVKLLDFGIAEPVEIGEVRISETSLHFLTIAYAAPEQIRRELPTVQADVYALGVLLFQVLTNELPYDFPDRNAERIGAQVLSDPPRKLSSAARRIGREPVLQIGREWDKRDLDALCSKAMHKDLSSRYASVEALLRDIDRYLSHETLEARKPHTPRYTLSKFVKRNSGKLGVAAAASLILCGLVFFYTVRLTHARNFAQAETARALAVQRFIVNLFSGNDINAGPSSDLRVVTLIDRGEKQMSALEDQPAVQAELYQTLGNIDEVLGRYDHARDLLKQALRMRSALYGPGQPEAAETMMTLAQLDHDQAHLQNAQDWAEKAVSIDRKILPPGDPRLIHAETMLGSLLIARGAYAKAVPLLQRLLQTQHAVRASIADIGETVSELANAYFYLGDYERSKALNQQALDIDRQLHGELYPDVASDYMTLASIERTEGHYQVAEQYGRKALQIDEKWFNDNHPEVASALTNLAETVTSEGRYQEAATLLKRALTIQQNLQSAPHNRVALILLSLANVELNKGDLSAAETDYTKGIAIYRSVYGDHFSIGVAQAGLARVYLRSNQLARSEVMFRDALKTFKRTIPTENLHVAVTELDFGKLLEGERRFSEAEELLLDGHAIVLKQSHPPADLVERLRAALAQHYEDVGKPELARMYRGSNDLPHPARNQ